MLCWNATNPAVVLLAGAIQFSSPALGQETNGRIERCVLLQQRLDIAMATEPQMRNTESARSLRQKAIHFCTHNKEAQGARTFARALILYGQQPFANEEWPPRDLIDERSVQ